MEKQLVKIGMIGAGRAAELHVSAYERVKDIAPVLKKISSSSYEKALIGKEKYNFEAACKSADEIIYDPEIDAVDICTPPNLHGELIIKALKAGKNVICEKPLTGYFGRAQDQAPIGLNVSKSVMYERLMRDLDEIGEAVKGSAGKFMYAENFVYAPAIQKMAEIITKKKSRILCLKGEESLKGSSSPVAGSWSHTGGGTFTRTGGHPLSAVLWLKQTEAKARETEIYPESVIADMGFITPTLSEYEHRHIKANPQDVEDFGTAVITFSDKTKAIIIATDTLLGGSRNYVEAYCNDAVLKGNLTMNDMMSTYFVDEDNLDDVYISEMLPIKTGWNNPFVVDEIVRGYSAEMQDFMEAVAYGREPVSGFKLAYDTAKLTYAAYKSAELGEKIILR
ncbi:MAG: Gfo/Idh/MocA family oxidoreductase [Firmicutes bacterium]|nr:Gfo/Idh/MocA family oxidoreductase [Bacillota bacterium]